MNLDKLKTTPIQYNEDDRAQRCLNIFPELNGQINISYVNNTNHIVAWHKHEKQTDYWFCIKGSFKVGIAYPEYSPTFDGEVSPTYHRTSHRDTQWIIEWFYLSDKKQEIITIPPGAYHGYRALEPNSILLYGLTHKYDVNDEFKVKPGHFNENWNTENR